MKTFFILILLLAMNLKVFSQYGSIGFFTSYNSYSLSDVKVFFGQFKSDLQVSAKTVDNFPPYIGAKIVYSNAIKSLKFNVNLGYNSTGGRISYADYSGKVNIDMTANIYSAGFQVLLPVYKRNSFSVFFSPGGYFAYTRFKLNSLFQIYEQKSNDKLYLISRTLGGGVGFTLEKNIKFLMVRAEIGADYCLPSNIVSPEHGDLFIVDKYQKKVKCQISGFRSAIGILYNLEWKKMRD